MKKLFVILAFAGILLQTFSPVVIIASYFANKEYIAKTLCENKAKPSMHCNGKCYLKKKLAKNAKEQSPTSNNEQRKQVVTLFYADLRIVLPPGAFFDAPDMYLSINEMFTATYNSAIFRPPAA